MLNRPENYGTSIYCTDFFGYEKINVLAPCPLCGREIEYIGHLVVVIVILNLKSKKIICTL
jgi:disulfide bond formation protein DsbB